VPCVKQGSLSWCENSNDYYYMSETEGLYENWTRVQ
jgi:hypothetical protein